MGLRGISSGIEVKGGDVRMTNNPNRFQHAGASTRSLLDPHKVLAAVGLKKGDVFLDAGSGSGYLSIAAAEIVGDTGKVYAVDIDEPSIGILNVEINRRQITNLTAIVADMMRNTTLAGNSIDICLMSNVLHGFVENDETADVMKEINRVLKGGGILAVVEFKKLENIPGPPFDIKLSPEQVAAVLTPYGYRRQKVIEVGTYHYSTVFIKVQNK